MEVKKISITTPEGENLVIKDYGSGNLHVYTEEGFYVKEITREEAKSKFNV